MTTTVDKNAKKEGRSWTPEQASAIGERSKTLLVSAAAGSGKTAVLTERILKSLTDPENPTDITELLVVTYTNAAAAEMRERIGKELKRAVEREPENSHLAKQLMLLPLAKIRTIDSFCNDILKSNAQSMGISPNYRIGDAAEQQILAFSVLEGMIGAIYDGKMPELMSPESFEEMADCLTDSRNMGALSELFYKIYEDFSCAERGIATLGEMANAYDPTRFQAPEQTPFGEHFMRRLHATAAHFYKLLDSDRATLACGTDHEVAYAGVISEILAMLSSLFAEKRYSRVPALLSVSMPDLPRKKTGVDLTDAEEAAKKHKAELSRALTELKKPFSFTEESWQYLFSGLYTRLRTLSAFLEKFDELYLSQKYSRGMLGYHDIERLVYNALWHGGERTELALGIAAGFKGVYIDEYQDVNSLQNKIFEAISSERNRFMVGDIKQSIYSFRHAEPGIFAGMKRDFPAYGAASDDGRASIFMSANFRCDEPIVNFVNGVFDKVFGVIGESIGYTDGDKLIFAKDRIPGMACGCDVPTVIVAEDPGTSEDDEVRSAVLPRIVAEKIEEILKNDRLNDGRAVMPKDIAIIMRSARGRASDYASALSARGIAAGVSEEKNFFLNSEILLALCLLNVIDNPRRDVYLAGLLRSPLFDFSADELYLISNFSWGETLYERLVKYCAANKDFSKGESFLRWLEEYREISEGVGADELIYKLYHETGLLALAAKGGGADNLTLLYNYARGFEGSTYKGLNAFIGFINTVIDRRSEFRPTKSEIGENEVSIITSHSSKGLEFPIVFVVDTGKNIFSSNRSDSARIAYVDGFGASFCLRTPSGLALVESPVHMAVKEKAKEARLEEEMRVLYVSLTRARERLFVVGSVTKDAEEYVADRRERGELLTSYSMSKMQTFLDIMVATRPDARLITVPLSETDEENNEADAPLAQELSEEDGASRKDFENEKIPDRKDAADTEASPDGLTGCDELLRRFTFVYPHEHLTVLPEKTSVSVLYPRVLDGSEDEPAPERTQRRRLPSFIDGGAHDESAKRGIATHMFMQFFDPAGLRANGAEGELSRLVTEGFLSAADSSRVRINEIEKFSRSELLKKMESAKRLYREMRFNAQLPAYRFTEDGELKEKLRDETLLVQGVIDCIIENEDGTLHLVDYKTDRLTAAELEDRELAASTLRRKHSLQLGYYAMAIERIFGKAPSLVEVYSLPLGDSIKIL